jgi:hypothetical protein
LSIPRERHEPPNRRGAHRVARKVAQSDDAVVPNSR